MPFRTTPPPVYPFPELQFHLPAPVTLDNGIRRYVVNGNVNNICQLSFCFRAGKFHQRVPAQATLAPLIALESSKHYDESQVAEIFDFYGTVKDVQSSGHSTEIMLLTLSQHLPEVLPVFLDCLSSPTMPQHIVELQRQQYATSYQIESERVRELANRELRRQLYGERHPLGHIATSEEILGLSRDDAVSFYNEHFHPANCSVVAVGDVGDATLKTIDAILQQWHSGKPANVQPEWWAETSDEHYTVVDRPGAVQAGLVMQLPAVSANHPDIYRLTFLVYILGGYFGSRLMSNIREDKGYTYGITATIGANRNMQSIIISTECDTQYTQAIIEQTRIEINRVRSEPVPLEELNNAKQQQLSELAKKLETPFRRASILKSTLLFNAPDDCFNRMWQTTRDITPEQLLQTAQTHLDPERLRIIAVADKSRLNN